MFGTARRSAAAYSQVGVETGVTSANPHKLILMLFDGAILALATAKVAIETKDVAGKGKAISRAIEIIANGLDASLDLKAGGELAERLSSLYEYMTERLLYANLHNSTATIDEVHGLLSGLRESWSMIAPEAGRQEA